MFLGYWKVLEIFLNKRVGTLELLRVECDVKPYSLTHLVIMPHCMLCMYVQGASVYAKSKTGATALTEAATNGHTEIVNLLNRHLLSTKSHLGMSST